MTQARAPRADAVRNQKKILDAARVRRRGDINPNVTAADMFLLFSAAPGDRPAATRARSLDS